jgi:phenylalanyl-tRNA synthetase beta chain
MNLSWKWLSEHVDLAGCTPHDVADAVTRAGLEVESIEYQSSALDGVVVGRIVERAQHPDADRLSVCSVDVGADEPLSIVCGAPNARTGLFAPVAMIGARLPNGMEIRKGKLRGQVSMGMLCSASELGLPEGIDGLLELPDGVFVPGTPVASAVGRDDVILELSVTPNRGDCLSVLGVAREVAALLERPLLQPSSGESEPWPASDVCQVVIDDASACPEYRALRIDGLAVGPSPAWLRDRLEAIGQRSINNLVDVTNWVLFELGQPLHAFDAHRLRGDVLRVRRAHDAESLATLDGRTRTLDSADLVIADAEGAVALAGVIGGAGSEVCDDTVSIVLECAHFAPSVVRATRTRHSISTDSSYRFERGIDGAGLERALARAVELIRRTQPDGTSLRVRRASGAASSDADGTVHQTILLPVDLPTRRLGMEVTEATLRSVLHRLGMSTSMVDATTVRVAVPTWRNDLSRPIDLVEEVGRVIGYDTLPATLPLGRPGVRPVRRTSAPREQSHQPILAPSVTRDVERIEDFLCGAGLHQAYTLAMVDPDRLALVQPGSGFLRLPSPLGHETSALRTTLIPGLLDAVARNRAHRQPSIALFELAAVFPEELRTDHEREGKMLAVVLHGQANSGWSGSPGAFDGHDVAALVSQVCSAVGRPCRIREGTAPEWAHPGVFARVLHGDLDIGWVGALHPSVGRAWDIEGPLLAFEIHVGALLDCAPGEPTYDRLSKTLEASRDAAFVVERSASWSAFETALARLQNPLLRSWELFDVYEGDRLPAHQKSLAIRFRYGKRDETLTDAQIDKAHGRTVRHIESELGATLRS